mmetsp:Transcript_25078/g.77330  ORF Transcript_25078/g.77330 Transcript_25078/m.77330 type:complete len:252 (+) Transcript_25078:101-856(+)
MQEAVPEGERSDRRIAERITKVEQVVSIIAVAGLFVIAPARPSPAIRRLFDTTDGSQPSSLIEDCIHDVAPENQRLVVYAVAVGGIERRVEPSPRECRDRRERVGSASYAAVQVSGPRRERFRFPRPERPGRLSKQMSTPPDVCVPQHLGRERCEPDLVGSRFGHHVKRPSVDTVCAHRRIAAQSPRPLLLEVSSFRAIDLERVEARLAGIQDVEASSKRRARPCRYLGIVPIGTEGERCARAPEGMLHRV